MIIKNKIKHIFVKKNTLTFWFIQFKRKINKWILPVIILFFFLFPAGCEFFRGFKLDGEYELSGGQYYDGILYDLNTFQGALSLKKSAYTLSYQLTFTKKDGQTISESKDETGSFSNTSEYQKSTYGPLGKYWTGIILFQPDSLLIPGSDTTVWQTNYEYYPSDKSLVLDASKDFNQKGYYTILNWARK